MNEETTEKEGRKEGTEIRKEKRERKKRVRESYEDGLKEDKIRPVDAKNKIIEEE